MLTVWIHEDSPGKPGMVRFKEMCTIDAFHHALETYLRNQWTFVDGSAGRVYDNLDYLSTSKYPEIFTGKKITVLPECDRIIAWVVEGGSEGFYFHIDTVKESVHTNLLLGKCFGNKNTALEMIYWINRFLLEEIE